MGWKAATQRPGLRAAHGAQGSPGLLTPLRHGLRTEREPQAGGGRPASREKGFSLWKRHKRRCFRAGLPPPAQTELRARAGALSPGSHQTPPSSPSPARRSGAPASLHRGRTSLRPQGQGGSGQRGAAAPSAPLYRRSHRDGRAQRRRVPSETGGHPRPGRARAPRHRAPGDPSAPQEEARGSPARRAELCPPPLTCARSALPLPDGRRLLFAVARHCLPGPSAYGRRRRPLAAAAVTCALPERRPRSYWSPPVGRARAALWES